MKNNNDKSPTISVSKLAEFVNATDSRKRTILKTIKSSSVEDITKRIRYSTAKSAIRTFMLDDKHDLKIFEQKKNELLSKPITSDFKRNDIKNSLLAIKQLRFCAQTFLVPYFEYQSSGSLNKSKRNISIDGVVVHLAPDIILLNKVTGNIVGAIKIIFSKGHPLTPFEGQIISGLVQIHLEKEFRIKINLKNCIAVDVFTKRAVSSPPNFVYHKMRIKKACEEINRLWNKV